MYKRKSSLNKVFKIKAKNDNLEYQRVLSKAYKELNRIDDEAVARSVSRSLINRVRELEPSQAMFLATVPKEHKLRMLGNFTLGSLASLTVRFGKAIRELWTDVFKLGTKHTVTDIMVNSGLFNKEFGKLSNFSSLEGFSLEEGLGLAEFAKAEFAKKDDGLTPEQRKAIGRAKRLLKILRDNRDDLVRSGAIYDFIDDYGGVTKSSRITARMSIEDKVRFLEMVQEIENFVTKSEASQANFLSNEYLNRRLRVLTTDYTRKQDEAIKDMVAEYLDQNVESIKQILNKNEDAQLLEDRLTMRFKLWRSEELDNFKQKSDVKARTVMRTELSIAYNFGKLSGFTSEEDLDRQVVWIADWELERNSKDYQICEFCEGRNGEVYTVRELLAIGAATDVGILKYRGTYKSKTDFKNPSLPMIPAHPNCSCYWELLPKPSKEEEESVTSTSVIPSTVKQVQTTTNIDTVSQQDQEAIRSRNIQAVLGAGLLVGGLFLLGRSNVWRSFYKSFLAPSSTRTAANGVVDGVSSASRFVQQEVAGEAAKKYTQVISDLVNKPSDLTSNLSTIIYP